MMEASVFFYDVCSNVPFLWALLKRSSFNSTVLQSFIGYSAHQHQWASLSELWIDSEMQKVYCIVNREKRQANRCIVVCGFSHQAHKQRTIRTFDSCLCFFNLGVCVDGIFFIFWVSAGEVTFRR
jgi:hypothetical protein